MTRGIWGDPERYLETYWRRFPGVWTHGDWASVDEDGYWFLHGRSDDTLNIAGKRIGPAELESAALDHPAVAEAAAIGVPHEVKGETAWLFVALKPGAEEDADGIKAAVAPRSARRSHRSGSSSSRRCRRRARPRSSAAPSARRRSARIPATFRPWRTPRPWRRSPMPSRALVTGGGRGIGADIARELAGDGWHVTVTGRTPEQVEAVAAEIGGTAVVGDVSQRADVERMVAEADPLDLLVANAGIGLREENAWEADLDDWWRVFETNVLGVHLSCSAVIPGMLERGRGRIVITGSGASYLPGSSATAYTASKAAACRYGETLASELNGRIPVFVISPGLVRTEMTADWFSDDAPWTPPELAPALVHALASGRFDALSGRYIHAEHDPLDELERRVDRILAEDLNAIRLRREA